MRLEDSDTTSINSYWILQIEYYDYELGTTIGEIECHSLEELKKKKEIAIKYAEWEENYDPKLWSDDLKEFSKGAYISLFQNGGKIPDKEKIRAIIRTVTEEDI